jgi:glutathione S-transferase
MSEQVTQPSSKTLWIWPSGIFPRRVAYYLRVKGLSTADLDKENLRLIPCHINTTSQELNLEAISGYEKRPPGFSLPVLRIIDSEKEIFIAESSSILEYLEDLFPDLQGYNNLLGDDIIQKAKVRDIVQLTNELLTWCNVQVRHSTDFSLLWSGMTKEQQSVAAAEDAKFQIARVLKQLEAWIDDNGDVSLVRAALPTTTDVTVAAAKVSMEEIYGIRLFEGFNKLEAWWGRYEASPWFVTKSEMEDVENGNIVSLLSQC